MVQIGDFHIGKAATSSPPALSITEASLLWDFTAARYKCIEETQIYHNFAHDKDLQALMKHGLEKTLETQVNNLEQQLNKFSIPLPERPPKSFKNQEKNSIYLSDKFLFKQVFQGCQNHIDYLARISRCMITNDSLRSMFLAFLQDEASLFDKLCKFGKLKGWIAPSPLYNPH